MRKILSAAASQNTPDSRSYGGGLDGQLDLDEFAKELLMKRHTVKLRAIFLRPSKTSNCED